MTCAGTLGKNATFADSTGTIGYIQALTPGEITIDSVDTTVHSSSEWKEYCPGLKDGGTVTIRLYKVVDDASQNRLYTRAISDASLNTDTYTITFPDGETMIFTGFITGVPIEIPMADYVAVSFSFKISGAVTGTLFT